MLGEDPNERFHSVFCVEQMLLQIQITLKDEGERGLEKNRIGQTANENATIRICENRKCHRVDCFKFF